MYIKITHDDPVGLIGLLTALSKSFPEHVNELLQLSHSSPQGITVEILPGVVEQTETQRKYYWKSLKGFADWCGMSPDDLHNEILCECFGSETKSTPFGWRRIPLQRSSESNRMDYSQLIETLVRVASGFGYVVPPPQRKLKPQQEKENE